MKSKKRLRFIVGAVLVLGFVGIWIVATSSKPRFAETIPFLKGLKRVKSEEKPHYATVVGGGGRVEFVPSRFRTDQYRVKQDFSSVAERLEDELKHLGKPVILPPMRSKKGTFALQIKTGTAGYVALRVQELEDGTLDILVFETVGLNPLQKLEHWLARVTGRDKPPQLGLGRAPK